MSLLAIIVIISILSNPTSGMHDSQVDEASIIQRTGNQSVERVCTYKRSSNKLCEVTSAILYQEFKRAKNENYANSYVKPVEGNENNRSPQKISCNQCHGILEEHLILLSTLTLSVS